MGPQVVQNDGNPAKRRRSRALSLAVGERTSVTGLQIAEVLRGLGCQERLLTTAHLVVTIAAWPLVYSTRPPNVTLLDNTVPLRGVAEEAARTFAQVRSQQADGFTLSRNNAGTRMALAARLTSMFSDICVSPAMVKSAAVAGRTPRVLKTCGRAMIPEPTTARGEAAGHQINAKLQNLL